MDRLTVDYGIDLGTTNSSIALLRGTETEVFRNNEGQEYTPSAVWVDKKGKCYVGRIARERSEDQDGDANTTFEFKLQMGTQQAYRFSGSGRELRSEELSAEVLKSLRGDAQLRTGEEVTAAVISVPAAFELPQNDATNKAARMAGLLYSPLIQEPAAAAMAYGFQTKSDRVFWMVFDIGGGTFDVAIVHVREGLIRLVAHEGDNDLGGKLIDWDIVNRVLGPVVEREYGVSDFVRGNARWKRDLSKLKRAAEEAKIRLSRDRQTLLVCNLTLEDRNGSGQTFQHELQRSDIEPVIEPYIEKAMGMCKRVLAEKRLSPGDIEKVILVGGPTLTPIVREMLSARLGIPLEFRMDPLTVVARGAAIFAGTQRLPDEFLKKPIGKGQYRVEFPEYQSIGIETEPLVGGRVTAPEGQSLAGFTIEFVESKSLWRSGKMQIGAQGTFMTKVHAEKGRSNEFLIQLCDSAGSIRECVPESITYTVGSSISGQPLTHSVGVALASNEMRIFLEKGTALPARRREIHRTTVGLKKGESGTAVRIPVVEGGNRRRADRNPMIGLLEVRGDKIRRDVPLGSEVEITIDINESRLVTTKAYIPILDEEYENVLELGRIVADPSQLADDLAQEKARLDKLRGGTTSQRSPAAQDLLRMIEDNKLLRNVESSLAAAHVEGDAADRCQRLLLELRIGLDEIEDLLEWPTLVDQAEKEVKEARSCATEYGTEDDRRIMDSLESAIRRAIADHDEDLLRQKTGEVGRVQGRLLVKQPGFWVALFNQLVEMKPRMSDRALAEQLIGQGRRAIDAGDVNTLETIDRQLIGLLPADERDQVSKGGKYDGTVL